MELLYESQVEVLEAMGLDSVWGSRDWIGGFHSLDLHALSLAVLYAQDGQVIWNSKVSGDPFMRDFKRYCKELMVEYPAVNRVPVREVHPSYFTYKPPLDYLVDRILYFFRHYLPEEGRPDSIECRYKSNDIVFVSCRYSTQDVPLVSISKRIAFDHGARLKAELARYLFKICEALVEHRLGIFKLGNRHYFYSAMRYVDELFSLEIDV